LQSAVLKTTNEQNDTTKRSSEHITNMDSRKDQTPSSSGDITVIHSTTTTQMASDSSSQSNSSNSANNEKDELHSSDTMFKPTLQQTSAPRESTKQPSQSTTDKTASKSPTNRPTWERMAERLQDNPDRYERKPLGETKILGRKMDLNEP
jgi:hypothetical protein